MTATTPRQSVTNAEMPSRANVGLFVGTSVHDNQSNGRYNTRSE